MLPGKLKVMRREGALVIMEPEQGENAEWCRFDESSDFSEEDAKRFFKALVNMWNDQI